MTQGQRDGKNPKFRILCKRCNSYQHTTAVVVGGNLIRLACSKCGNAADNVEEEAKHE